MRAKKNKEDSERAYNLALEVAYRSRKYGDKGTFWLYFFIAFIPMLILGVFCGSFCGYVFTTQVQRINIVKLRYTLRGKDIPGDIKAAEDIAEAAAKAEALAKKLKGGDD